MGAIQRAVLIPGLAAAAVFAVVRVSAWAQDIDKGRTEFMASCARCHGADGKGSGPHAADLKVKPADLTVLAKQTNGMFNPGAVYQMIDGRNARFAHRSADMPIWGCRHANGSTTPEPAKPPATRKHGRPLTARSENHEPRLDSLLDLPCDADAVIRDRILSIVGYLSSIQEK